MMITIAVTGEIASGKSYILSLMQQRGIPVYNADNIVADLYKNDTQLIEQIKEIAPDAIQDGCVDKNRLRKVITHTPCILSSVEAIVHPAVQKKQDSFLQKYKQSAVVVLEIPLLFEVNRQDFFDIVIMVYACPSIQLLRLKERQSMTHRDFLSLHQRQKPRIDKMALSDYVIDSSHGYELVHTQIENLIALFHKMS